MNFFFEEKKIIEMNYGLDFAYVLTEEILVSATEYKVLKNQKDSSFLRCVETKYNGKSQLYYVAKDYKPFSSLLRRIDASTFVTIIGKLIFNILQLKNNGFLSCQNILLSMDKIFVDMGTLNVSMVYLPINRHLYDSTAEFDNELRTQIIQAVSGVLTLKSNETMHLVRCLTDSSMNLAFIYEQIWGKNHLSFSPYKNIMSENKPPKTAMKQYGEGKWPQTDYSRGNTGEFTSVHSENMPEEVRLLFPNTQNVNMRLLSANLPIVEEIEVTKENFVIGKGEEGVDASISFNPMISRKHCQIIYKDGMFYLRDLRSSNGTKVNGRRLAPEKWVKISNGDMICLANTEFRVVIE